MGLERLNLRHDDLVKIRTALLNSFDLDSGECQSFNNLGNRLRQGKNSFSQLIDSFIWQIGLGIVDHSQSAAGYRANRTGTLPNVRAPFQTQILSTLQDHTRCRHAPR